MAAGPGCHVRTKKTGGARRDGLALTMLRTGLCRTSVALPRLGGARLLHQLPPMPAAIAEGCEPFLSKRTTSLLWTQWQAGLLQRLNEEVKGA